MVATQKPTGAKIANEAEQDRYLNSGIGYHLRHTGNLDAAVGRYHAGPAGSPQEASRYIYNYRYVLEYGRLPPKR